MTNYTPAERRADQRIVAAHTGGNRCDQCGTAGGCLTLLAAVRRRTALQPYSSATTILMNFARRGL
jgi:hypothetical protein